VSPAQQALRDLARINGLIRALAEPHFASYGLSMAQWGVLRTLARRERAGRQPPKLHELGAEMVVRPPSLSATVDRMVCAGLISRSEDPDDRRARRITLSLPGRRLLERRTPDHRAWVEGVMTGLSREDQVALSRLLTKAGDHMRGLIPSSSAPTQARASQSGSSDDEHTETS
jgi:DNA-binding MarR family transcriptional regulator